MQRILLLAALVGLSACDGPDDRGSQGAASPPPVPVTVALARSVERPVPVLKTVNLASRVDFALVAEGHGRVEDRVVEEGAEVHAGQPVIRLDAGLQRSDLRAAEARLRELLTSPAAIARREEAEALRDRALVLLDRQTVTAPKSGILDRYLVEEGEVVAAGTAVARLVDPALLFCRATVLEEEIGLVEVGSPVSLEVRAHPGVSFPGRVLRTGAGALRGSSLYEVEAAIDPDSRLRPGFTGELRLELRMQRRVLAVPREAVSLRLGRRRVFVAEPREEGFVAVEREVEAHPLPGRPAELDLRAGVREGERIIVRGALGLSTGDPVSIDGE